MRGKIKFVVNPVAGNHKAGRLWPELEKGFRDKLGDFSVEFTKHKNHGQEITRCALKNGYGCITAVGGDGTLNEVINGFMQEGQFINDKAVLGVIPLGTGSDFARTIGSPGAFEKTLSIIAAGQTRDCDLGVITCRDAVGENVRHCFINVADAGFGAEVAKTVNNGIKLMGHFFTYFLGLLRTLATFQNKTVRLRIDEDFDEEVTVNSIVIANGRFFGGGMRVAPGASIDDGLFDIIVIGDITKAEAVANIRNLYNGTLSRHKKVACYRGRKITIESEHKVFIEADGETPGLLPATFEMIPRAVNLIC